MKTSLVVLASLALATALPAQSAAVAPAPANPPSLHSNVRLPSGLLWAALDVNRDGELSPSEIENATVSLAGLDVNEDGWLSLDEFRRAAGANGRSRHLGQATDFNLLFALDANHDECLQGIEMSNAVASLRRLDLDGDGHITRSELRTPLGASTRLAARL